jgi:hypothetical protein
MKNNMKKNINKSWLFVIIFVIFLLLLLFLLLGIVFNYLLFKKNKKLVLEPFQWSQNTIDDFLNFQSTVNPLSHFNIPILQEQASQEEVNYLLQNGYWPWSKYVEDLYLDDISKNKIQHITPAFSMVKAKKKYNENAMKQMLSWNTKEGEFLLYGGTNKNKEVIKCFSYLNGPSSMKKIQQNGYNLWNGYKNEKITNLKDDEIPLEMPGFNFVGNPCNPCLALENNYSCPFKINIKGNESVSDIWKNLWNI